MSENIPEMKFKKTRIIKTPYIDNAPYQPVYEDKGESCIVVDDKYVEGLAKPVKFQYIYCILSRSRQISNFNNFKSRVDR
jgi:tRNA (Thr-GGU) A37 N-methylase